MLKKAKVPPAPASFSLAQLNKKPFSSSVPDITGTVFSFAWEKKLTLSFKFPLLPLI